MRLALAITTFERPDALAAVLATAGGQRSAPDEILVADDGSGPATAEVVRRFAQSTAQKVHHVRQEHLGFRLTRLRNLAIAATRADYIVFVDGDMLLHPEFVADHRAHARAGYFTQGVRILLDDTMTTAALQRAAAAQPIVTSALHGRGLRRLYGLHSNTAAQLARHAANSVIAIKGCNQAFWRSDLVRVNGFDEAIEGWGPEDKELCARLQNAGVRRQTLLFGGIAWHLAHPPANRDQHARNLDVLAATLAARRTRCTRGLDGHASAPEVAAHSGLN